MKYSVPDMTCGHCTSSIESALKALDSGANVKTDLVTHTVEIETSVAETAILAAMKNEGYPASRID